MAKAIVLLLCKDGVAAENCCYHTEARRGNEVAHLQHHQVSLHYRSISLASRIEFHRPLRLVDQPVDQCLPAQYI